MLKDFDLSICIPTYNRPQLIRRAIESILSQSYGRFEVLIFDNSDNWETHDVVAQYSDQRIQYKKNSENLGIAGNWNALLFSARGEYVKFLNDDDWLEQDCIEVFIHHLKSYSDVVVAGCRARYWDNKGRLLKIDNLSGNGSDYLVSPKYGPLLMYEDQLPLRTPTHVIFRRKEALWRGGFSEKLHYARDINLWADLVSLGNSLCIESHPLVNFFRHPEQDVHKINIDIRISDQLFVKQKLREAAEACVSSSVTLFDEMCSYLTLREVLLLLKKGDFIGSLNETRKYSRKVSLLAGIRNVLFKDFFKRNLSKKYDVYRTYIK